MDADAAVQMLLRRSGADVEAAAADDVEEGERTVVRWEWSAPRAHLWEERLPAVGDVEPATSICEVDGASGLATRGDPHPLSRIGVKFTAIGAVDLTLIAQRPRHRNRLGDSAVGALPRTAGDATKSPASAGFSRSRRPDSNRGPRHYETHPGDRVSPARAKDVGVECG